MAESVCESDVSHESVLRRSSSRSVSSSSKSRHHRPVELQLATLLCQSCHQTSISLPKFSGQKKDWGDFVELWVEYLAAVNPIGAMTDEIKFQRLMEAVDSRTRDNIRYHRKNNASFEQDSREI
jgi:hypothetical protein